MLVKPFLKHTYTLLAPQRRAEVAQSNAVSPAPRTITTPFNSGREEPHGHMPAQRGWTVKLHHYGDTAAQINLLLLASLRMQAVFNTLCVPRF